MNTTLAADLVPLAEELDKNKVTPGVLGFIVFALLGVAVWFLLKSMNRHLEQVEFKEKTDGGDAGPAGPAGPGGTGPAGEGPGDGGDPRDDAPRGDAPRGGADDSPRGESPRTPVPADSPEESPAADKQPVGRRR
ncbi:hypothetical protein ACHZ98_21920 [Streptomyces sp. MAR4 CNY-716]